MSIEDLSIVSSYKNTPSMADSMIQFGSTGVRIKEAYDNNGSTRKVWIGFSTERGLEAQKSFSFDRRSRSWPKSGSGDKGNWTSYSQVTVNASDCVFEQKYSGGRYYWYVPIEKVFPSTLWGGTWKYSTRKYASIEFYITLRCNFTDSFVQEFGETQSELADATLWIGYLASYMLTAVYYESSDKLVFRYSTTWERTDDRFRFDPDQCKVAGEGSLFVSEPWGVITSPGRIELDANRWLARDVRGKNLTIRGNMNPSYRVFNAEDRPALEGYFAEGYIGSSGSSSIVMGDTLTKPVYSQCNTPKIVEVPSQDPYVRCVQVTDSGDLGCPIEQVTLTVRATSGWPSSNSVTAAVGQTVTLESCPLNTPMKCEAIASNDGGVSKSVSISLSPITVKGMMAIIDSATSDERAVIELSTQYSVTPKSNATKYQLSGRDYPSAFSGQGRIETVTLAGKILDEDGSESIALEMMPFRGTAWFRFYDGRVYRCTIDSSISWSEMTHKNVSISGDVVG